MTTITGYLYNAQGTIVVSGELTLTLQQDMVIGGIKVAPFAVTVDLAAQAPAGLVHVTVYPTVGATPAGLSYLVEFDPTPLDTTKPRRAKDGYWSNYWAVPDTVVDVAIGSFVEALRGTAATNYLPLSSGVNKFAGTMAGMAGAVAGYLIVDVNGTARKIAILAT